MSESVFRFQHFAVKHDHCAHKVGTDGVLLGAWAEVDGCRRILDIGTGSGLMAMMVAQRNVGAQVVGVEIDEDSAQQAVENVAASPFAQRIKIFQADIREYYPDELFDCILCNPPFFLEDTLPENVARARARHASSLKFEDLISFTKRLLTTSGIFQVILPYNALIQFENHAFIAGMRLCRKCMVRTTVHKPPKRVLLSFSRCGKVFSGTEELVLQDENGHRSKGYQDLTKAFYL